MPNDGTIPGGVGAGGDRREYHRLRMRAWRKNNPEKLKANRKKGDKTKVKKAIHARTTIRQRARYQAESIPTARNNGSSWSIEDEMAILDHTRTARELARTLGRSYWAIVIRRRDLKAAGAEGLETSNRERKGYTEKLRDDDERAARRPEQET